METIFVSRAGADVAMSETIGAVLDRAGYRVILQQRNFANKSFIEQMQSALESGARVVALLSPSYLASDYCAAEWQSVLADDPLNKQSRLIVLRIADCKPAGLLKALAYWDLVPATDTLAFEQVVLQAVRGAAPAAPATTVAAPPMAERQPDATTLPLQLTAFVGREAVVQQIRTALEHARLVTLLGPGGIGKTRTALEVAAAVRDAYGDGTWFADFAAVEGRYVVASIATLFGIREEQGKPYLDTVVAHLRTQRALIILDNCEHVIAESRAVAVAIVRHCPMVRLIATSREALGVGGEDVIRLPALGLPDSSGRVTPEQARHCEAVALFTVRAEAAQPGFVLRDEDVATVVAICRELDGIALAIELAAARVRILSVGQLAARLSERFRLLTGGSKTALPRQQTMRALIDWSYDLLDTQEQRLFRRLSIFPGGWTLDGAFAVCGEADDDEFTSLDRLTSLVDKSLVAVDTSGNERRFRFLESTRVYAQERMHGEHEFDELAQRRTRFFAELAGDGKDIGAHIVERFAAIQAELENLRAVLKWALDDGHDVDAGARIAFSLGRFWSTRLPLEGQRWLALAQSKLGHDADVTLVAEVAIAVAAMLPHGTFERIAATERALAAARSSSNALTLSRALGAMGDQLIPIDRVDEARAAYEDSLALATVAGSDWDRARALAGLTLIAQWHEDYERMREVGGEAKSIFAAIGAIDGVAHICLALGQSEFSVGNREQSMDLLRQARAGYGELGNHRSSALAAVFLALFSLEMGRPDDACDYARDALDSLATDRHPFFVTQAIKILGHVATLSGDTRRGALLYGYTTAALAKMAHPVSEFQLLAAERDVQLLTERLGAETLTREAAAGAALTVDRALHEALAVRS